MLIINKYLHVFLAKKLLLCYTVAMLNDKKALSENAINLKSQTKDFIYGNLFPVILCLFSLAFFVADLSMIGFGGLILVGSFILIVYDDMTPTIPVLMLLPMTMRDTSILWYNVYPYFIILPVAIALIINFIRFPFRKPRFDNLCWCLLAIIFTFLTGGLFTSSFMDFFKGIGFLLLCGVCAFAMHFVYLNKTKCPPNFDLKKYFCYCFVLATTLACVQLVYARIYVKLFSSKHFIFPGFCWANTAHIANLIIIAIPLLCYLIVRAKKVLPLLICLLFLYACLFNTKSEACFFIAIAFTPLLIFNVIKHAQKKHLQKIYAFVLFSICVVIIVICYYALFQHDSLIKFLDRSVDDSGRHKFYLTGFELFTKNPIFGVGIGYAINNGLEMFSGYFHSVFIQSLATTGLLGLTAYVLLYVYRIKKLTAEDTLLSTYSLISFSMYLVYAMIDNSEFNVVLVYITLFVSIIGLANEKGNDFSLPLTSKLSISKLSNQFCT